MNHSYRTSLATLVAVGLWALLAAGGGAQEPAALDPEAPLQGVVVDEATYQPVDSATVSLVGTDFSVSTGRWGSFAFSGVPQGRLSLQVSAPGHPSVVQDVEVQEGRIVFVQIVLPSVAAVLSELLVPATGRGVSDAARSAADLLALQVPRTRVSSGIVGSSDYEITLRARNTFQGSTAPLILIDGVVLSQSEGAFDALERIPASDVERLEVLKGPAAASLYPYAANGVINVVTKRGRQVR